MRIAVLTVSDAGARGERADTSGDAIVRWAEGKGYAIAARALVPDEVVRIAATLTSWADADEAESILTTGGPGLGPRGATPAPSRLVAQREATGDPPHFPRPA